MSDIHVVVVGVDFSVTDVVIDNDLPPMQKLVGGWIEGVGLWSGFDLGQVTAYVNEEGIIEQLPFNVGATQLVFGPSPIFGSLVIVGFDNEGEWTSVPDDTRAKVLTRLGEWVIPGVAAITIDVTVRPE